MCDPETASRDLLCFPWPRDSLQHAGGSGWEGPCGLGLEGMAGLTSLSRNACGHVARRSVLFTDRSDAHLVVPGTAAGPAAWPLL